MQCSYTYTACIWYALYHEQYLLKKLNENKYRRVIAIIELHMYVPTVSYYWTVHIYVTHHYNDQNHGYNSIIFWLCYAVEIIQIILKSSLLQGLKIIMDSIYITMSLKLLWSSPDAIANIIIFLASCCLKSSVMYITISMYVAMYIRILLHKH